MKAPRLSFPRPTVDALSDVGRAFLRSNDWADEQAVKVASLYFLSNTDPREGFEEMKRNPWAAATPGRIRAPYGKPMQVEPTSVMRNLERFPGKEERMYHGTFHKFDPKEIRADARGSWMRGGALGTGSYFTTNRSHAELFGNKIIEADVNPGGKQLPSVLSDSDIRRISHQAILRTYVKKYGAQTHAHNRDKVRQRIIRGRQILEADLKEQRDLGEGHFDTYQSLKAVLGGQRNTDAILKHAGYTSKRDWDDVVVGGEQVALPAPKAQVKRAKVTYGPGEPTTPREKDFYQGQKMAANIFEAEGRVKRLYTDRARRERREQKRGPTFRRETGEDDYQLLGNPALAAAIALAGAAGETEQGKRVKAQIRRPIDAAFDYVNPLNGKKKEEGGSAPVLTRMLERQRGGTR